MRYTVLDEIPGPLGARHPTITPFQALATGDGNIIVAAGNDGLYVRSFCAAISGRDDLARDGELPAITNALPAQPGSHGCRDEARAHAQGQASTAEWIAILGFRRRALRPDQHR